MIEDEDGQISDSITLFFSSKGIKPNPCHGDTLFASFSPALYSTRISPEPSSEYKDDEKHDLSEVESYHLEEAVKDEEVSHMWLRMGKGEFDDWDYQTEGDAKHWEKKRVGIGGEVRMIAKTS